MVREIITINVGQAGIQFGDVVWQQYVNAHNFGTTIQDGYYQKPYRKPIKNVNKPLPSNINDPNIPIKKKKKKKKKRRRQKPIRKQKFQLQHQIDQKNNIDYDGIRTFFSHMNDETWQPRCVMVDTEPDIIDEYRYSKFYNPQFCLAGKEDCSNLFASGFVSRGKEAIDVVNDRIRKNIDGCDHVQGFIINNAVGGGTGSGLGALILEQLSVDYRYQSTVGFHIYPFNNHMSNCVVEPYNALLATHWFTDFTVLSIMFDNRKLYQICKEQLNLNISLPSYHDMNLLMAKIEASFTASFRWKTEYMTIADINEWQTNMVPFPRLHFINTSMTPIVSDTNITKIRVPQILSKILIDGFVRHYYPFLSQTNYVAQNMQYQSPLYEDLMKLIYANYSSFYKRYDKKWYDLENYKDLVSMSVNPHYFFVEINNFDEIEDKYMAAKSHIHGKNISSDECIKTKKDILQNEIKFIDWVPTGFKTEAIPYKLSILEDDTMMETDTQVISFLNNVSISRYLTNRILRKAEKMFSQRAYIHWYVCSGLEEAEFREAFEFLGFLEKDYLDVVSEEATDSICEDD